MTAVRVRAGAPGAPCRNLLAAVAALTLGTSLALAQQQPAPPAQPVPAPKATPRPMQPAQKARRKQPAAARAAGPRRTRRPAGSAQAEQPPIVYSPWTKFCGKDEPAGEGSLPHREGSAARDRPVPRRRRADRAGGRGEEAVPHHAAARHAAAAGHAHAARQGAAAAGPLHRLPAERLHGGLRREPGLRRAS